MSNYQQPPYGAGYGVSPNSNQPPYIPPAYQNPYNQPENIRSTQGQGQNHTAANYGAYGYNMAMPVFSAPPVPPPVPPLPIYQGWNPEPASVVPPYSAPQNNAPYPGYSDNSQNTQQYHPPPSRTNYQTSSQAPRPFEHNELSEGEFDDSTVNTHTPPVAFAGKNYYGGNRTGYSDNAQRAVYSRPQNFSPQQTSYPVNNFHRSTADGPPSKRQKSDHYSPTASSFNKASESQSKQSQQLETAAPNLSNVATNDAVKLMNSQSQIGGEASTQDIAPVNGVKIAKPVEVTTQTKDQAGGHEHLSMGFTSHAEAKKKAQHAIFNLWPYDVRYQDYVEEGVDAEIVGKLFDDLRMSRKPGGQITETGQKSLPDLTRTSSLQENIDLAIRGTTVLQSKSEDSSSAGVEAPAIVNGAGPPIKTTMNEKERTLQAKMEALRKSREERAQRAAASKGSGSTGPPPNPTEAEKAKIAPESSKEAPKESTPTPAPGNSTSIAGTLPEPAKPVAPIISSPAPIIAPQPHPSIPGLFLNSSVPSTSTVVKADSAMFPPPRSKSLNSTALSPSPVVNGTNTMQAPAQHNVRKRPVAADFEDSFSTTTTVKRPFGHSRDKPLVINVSDDEGQSDDDDVEMDLESEANQDSPIQSARALPDGHSTGLQNLPTTTNTPCRNLPSPIASQSNTPAAQTPTRALVSRPEDLQRKESEIEMLKKKIAEAEARKRARQSSSSGMRTPKPIEGSQTPVATSSNLATSIAIAKLITIADMQVNADQQRLAEVDAEKVAKAEELRKNDAERIRLRRLEIEAELPLVESEFQQNQRRFEEMKAEMAKIQASLEESQKRKQKYDEEMARLSRETEDQLQAQKAKLKDLTKNEVETSVVTKFQPPPIVPQVMDEISQPAANGVIPDRSRSVSEGPPDTKPPNTSAQDVNVALSPAPAQQSASPVISVSTNPNSVAIEEPQRSGSVALNDMAQEQSSADHALEAALQEAVRAEADSHGYEEDVDIEDSYAPDPNQLAPASPVMDDEQATASPQADQSSIDAELPNNDEPEYEPSAPGIPTESNITEQSEDEEPEYEPPEATPLNDSPTFGIARDEDTVDFLEEPAHAGDVNSAMEVISDVASEDLQQSGNEVILQNGSAPQSSEMTESFTPYQSPLRIFRAYRFHPDFKKNVAGGLRSLTYSHRIDPLIELCKYELAGGICNDSTCELLHFKDISLPDDVILTALGSPEEFKGARRDAFCDGLKSVLMGLRRRKVRDFDAIADEILKYRRKFLDDPSKILPLESVEI